MLLSRVPQEIMCMVATVHPEDRDMPYWRAGIRPGRWLKVICRHPRHNPQIIEVQLDNLLRMSLPVGFARKVQVTLHEGSPL